MKEESQVGDTLCHRPSGTHCHAEAAGRSIFHAKRFDSAGSPIVRLSGCFAVPRPQAEVSFAQNGWAASKRSAGSPTLRVPRCFAALSMTTLKRTRHDRAWSLGGGLERRMRAGVAACGQEPRHERAVAGG